MKKITNFVKNLVSRLLSVFSPKVKEITLDEALKIGEVKILARTIKGEISEKIATRKTETIAKLGLEPKGNGNKTPNDSISFVSILDEGWRSFKRNLVIEAEMVGKSNIKITL